MSCCLGKIFDAYSPVSGLNMHFRALFALPKLLLCWETPEFIPKLCQALSKWTLCQRKATPTPTAVAIKQGASLKKQLSLSSSGLLRGVAKRFHFKPDCRLDGGAEQI